jgi:mRNA interferase RelE/StbE
LSGGEGHRLRVGDYRILYAIDDSAKKVIVYRVKHRREAYR